MILITGATGFIGRAVVDSLFGSGEALVAVVRKQVNTLPDKVKQIVVGDLALLAESLGGDSSLLTQNNTFNIQDGDVANDLGIISLASLGMMLRDVDVVVHLAARAHLMQDDSTNPLAEFRKVNQVATLVLARLAAQAGVKRFVFLSSIGVSGNNNTRPFIETDLPKPQEPYAISKYEAEQGLLALAAETEMEVVIIRPPLVYGPNAPGNFSSLMHWMHKNIPLPFGAIHNKRSFVGLDNLVDLILTCIDHPAAANEVFLVSDGEDLSTTELLNRITVALGNKPKLLPINQQLLELVLKLIGKKDLAQRLCGSLQIDISKAKSLLNWMPPVSVEEGLRKTAQHFLESQSL